MPMGMIILYKIIDIFLSIILYKNNPTCIYTFKNHFQMRRDKQSFFDPVQMPR